MADLVNLQVVIPRANLNRVDLDLSLIAVTVPYVDINGVPSGGSLEVEVMVSDPRFTAQQKTSLKNGIKMIGQVVLALS